MDMPTIETLKRARIKWLDVSFSYKDKNHFIEIRTPFPDMFHDNISLVLYKDADGNLMLSDDGYTMDELGTLGFDTNTSVKRKKYFNDTLLSFSVQYAPTGELIIHQNTFPLQICTGRITAYSMHHTGWRYARNFKR